MKVREEEGRCDEGERRRGRGNMLEVPGAVIPTIQHYLFIIIDAIYIT